MVWHHRFTREEVTAATGLSPEQAAAELKRFGITPDNRPKRQADGKRWVITAWDPVHRA